MNQLDLLTFVALCSDNDLIRSGDEEDDLFPSDEAGDSASDDDGLSFFEEEETKSRFTNYSMTSSVLRRNEGTWARAKIVECYVERTQ